MKDNKTFFIIVVSAVILIFAVLAVYLLGGRQKSISTLPISPVTVEEQQELQNIDVGDTEQDLKSIDQDLQEL